jgi:hypothetical protein
MLASLIIPYLDVVRLDLLCPSPMSSSGPAFRFALGAVLRDISKMAGSGAGGANRYGPKY